MKQVYIQKVNFYACTKQGGFLLNQYPQIKLRKKRKTPSAKLFEAVFVQASPKIFTLGGWNTTRKSPEHVNYLK